MFFLYVFYKNTKKVLQNFEGLLFIMKNLLNYLANFLYLFINLSTLPAVSTNFTLPV